jgi:hypothetical protein
MNEHIQDAVKAIVTNTTVLAVVTFANVELLLRIVLLAVTIAYTSFQFWKSHQNK